MDELKPCPFCGSEAKLEVFVRSWVRCPECQISTSFYNEEEQAINAWNKRAERTCKMEWNGESGIHSMQNCSCCDEFFSDYCELPENFNFCPNCGARVVGD